MQTASGQYNQHVSYCCYVSHPQSAWFRPHHTTIAHLPYYACERELKYFSEQDQDSIKLAKLEGSILILSIWLLSKPNVD